MKLLNTKFRLWNRHGVKVVWTLTIVWLLVILWTIAWDTRSHHQIKLENYSLQTIDLAQNTKLSYYRVQDITSANLFGDPTPKKITIAPKPTTLDLSLDGLLWVSNGSASRAIIASGKKKPKLYAIGQEIVGANGVSIKEIQRNEVILNRNGLTESLSLIKSTINDDQRLIDYNLQNPTLAGITAPDDYEAYSKSVADAQKNLANSQSN